MIFSQLEVFFKELATWSGVKSFCAGVFSFCLTAAGHPESAFSLLLCLMGVDFVLGMSRGWLEKNIRRERLTKGALKIFFYWTSVAILVLVDESLSRAFCTKIPYRLHDFFIAYLAIGESLSCIGHMAFFGFSFPEPLLKMLKNYKEKIDQGSLK